MTRYLNVVSFNVPYPGSFGSIVDVYYQIKSLHESGVKIILHTFEYGDNNRNESLNEYCEEVHYYKRTNSFKTKFSSLPFIVKSRRTNNLLSKLLENDYPILFEGIHTCYYLGHPLLRKRLKLVRAHNIEHVYHESISAHSDSLIRKAYLYFESLRLKRFEQKLRFANYILPVSTTEAGYFHHRYKDDKIVLVPLFHKNNRVEITKEYKSYVLFHADFNAPWNRKIALQLIEKVAKKDKKIAWVIAGIGPDEALYKAASKVQNVEVKSNLRDEELKELIQNASINLLITTQSSSVKMKLVDTLYNAHYVLANKRMLDGSGLDSLCVPVTLKQPFLLRKIREYLYKDFPETEIKERQNVLNRMYNNATNAQKIIDLLG
ncbi:hypothetical protein LJC52_04280 [Bacteroidales bacterium OttesenSCG-928-A17]|nr:hypothetical protein [Bacteroidales bacterium OttesenSCG-928-A17]